MINLILEFTFLNKYNFIVWIYHEKSESNLMIFFFSRKTKDIFNFFIVR